MSTPSLLLLCAGAASSLAGVWTMAGLSEGSALRLTPRVSLAAITGLLGEALLYGRAAPELRAELSLPLLFGTASVVALAVGAAKLEAALADKNGPLVVRRASGIVAGSVCGMAAVGAVSLDLSSNSLTHARLGWGFMFALVASVLIVFAQRGRYAGAGLLALGRQALILALVGGALLAGARLTVAAPAGPIAAPPAVEPAFTIPEARVAPPSESAAPEPSGADLPVPAVSAPSAPSAPSLAADSAAPAGSAPAPGAGRQLEIGAVTTRGLFEADARGGVTRRLDRLQTCLEDPKNQQSGELTLKINIDASGSVANSKPTAGDLMGKPLADCLILQFYKMGFAAPSADNAGFDITLRAP